MQRSTDKWLQIGFISVSCSRCLLLLMMMMMMMVTILGKTTRRVYSSFKVVRCEIGKNIYMSREMYGRIKYNPDNLGKESKKAI